MGKADLLSRRADYDQGNKDNEDITFIKEEWLTRGLVHTSRQDLIPIIQNAQSEMDITGIPDGLKQENGIWKRKQ